MTEPVSDTLDQSPPDAILLHLIGQVTLAWSFVDEMLSAALYSLLAVDKFEFTILVGRIEFPTKLDKLQAILTHRKDAARLKFITSLRSEMSRLRADRNALTHGVYQGKSSKGEVVFLLGSDVIFDQETDDTAYKMRVFTNKTIFQHLTKTLDIAKDIASQFDAAKMIELRSAPLRVPKEFQIDPAS